MTTQLKLEDFVVATKKFTKRVEQNNPFDVVIIGGGLAGLTLAIQLKRITPKVDILVLEKRPYPAPEAAFKIGESSLEGASYYFSRVVGMREHLENDHLKKYALCFLSPYENNTDITKRPELRVSGEGLRKLFLPSYQIDRGRFENRLIEENIKLGVTFLDNCKVTDFHMADPLHTLTFRQHNREFTTQARWMVDASGVTGFLKNRFKLATPVEHDINAVWFRVNDVIDINNWSQDVDWRERWLQTANGEKIIDPDYRKLCTNHLCGTGYWVWLIPLSTKVTSVGIVADPAIHPLKNINRLDKAMSWLEQYEPELAHHIDRDKILDFQARNHFAANCKQVFSTDRWAITGVAGVFIDPLYSPGSELISISNTLVSDLILQSLFNQNISEKVSFFNEFYLDFVYKAILCEYQRQYPLFGNAKITTAKMIWYAVWYFAIIGLLTIHHKYSDLIFMKSIKPNLQRFFKLQSQVQSFFIKWHTEIKDEQLPAQTYVDYASLPFLVDLHNVMGANLDDNRLREQLTQNISLLEEVATVLFQQAPELVEEMPSKTVNLELLDLFEKMVWQPLSTEPSLEKKRSVKLE